MTTNDERSASGADEDLSIESAGTLAHCVAGPDWAPGGWQLVGSVSAIATLAVAHPVLDLLARNANFFVARDSPWWEPVGLAVVLAGVLPLVGIALVLFARAASRTVSAILHLGLLAFLMALLGIQVLNRFSPPGGLPVIVAVGAALAMGAGAAIAYRLSPTARSVLAFGWVLPVVAAAMFLFASPVARLIIPAEASASGLEGVQRTPPIVFIILDELPTVSLMRGDASIDAELFPTFSRLAEEGTWYRNTTTVASFTMESVPSILTGNYAEEVGVAVAAKHPNTMFALLADDYDVHAFEPLTQLCPQDVCDSEAAREPTFAERMRTFVSDTTVVGAHVLAPESLREHLVPIGHAWGGFAESSDAEEGDDVEIDQKAERDAFNVRAKEARETDRRTDFSELAEAIRASAGDGVPSFYFLHSFLPHSPWEYLPSGNRYGHLRVAGLDDEWGDDEWFRAQGRQRHLLQTAMVDHELGGVIEAIEDAGSYDEAMIIITADHGVTFEPGNDGRTMEEGTVGDIAAVPLFIKYPGSLQVGIIDDPVETVDIVPTILDVLGTAAPDRTDGRSLLALDQVPRTERQIFQRGEMFSLPADARHQDEALIRKVEAFGPDGGTSSLFRFGPYSELAGQRWTDLVLGEPSSLRVQLEQGELLAHVDLMASRLPVHITGTVTGNANAEGRYLVLALNGDVEAIAKIFTGRDAEHRFGTLVPESALVSGANDVQLAEIVAAGEGAPILRPIEVTDP